MTNARPWPARCELPPQRFGTIGPPAHPAELAIGDSPCGRSDGWSIAEVDLNITRAAAHSAPRPKCRAKAASAQDRNLVYEYVARATGLNPDGKFADMLEDHQPILSRRGARR